MKHKTGEEVNFRMGCNTLEKGMQLKESFQGLMRGQRSFGVDFFSGALLNLYKAG